MASHVFSGSAELLDGFSVGAPGSTARLRGLTSRPRLNNAEVEILTSEPVVTGSGAAGRCTVRVLSSNEVIRVKPVNLQVVLDTIVGSPDSLLFQACFIGDSYAQNVKRLLTEEGANPNVIDRDKDGTPGGTPLNICCLQGHVKIAKHLIAAKASIDALDHLAGCCPLTLAYDGAGIQESRLPGHRADTLGGCMEIFKLLLRSKAAVDVYNRDGETTLIKACRNAAGRAEQGVTVPLAVVKLLLSANASVDLPDKE